MSLGVSPLSRAVKPTTMSFVQAICASLGHLCTAINFIFFHQFSKFYKFHFQYMINEPCMDKSQLSIYNLHFIRREFGGIRLWPPVRVSIEVMMLGNREDSLHWFILRGNVSSSLELSSTHHKVYRHASRTQWVACNPSYPLSLSSINRLHLQVLSAHHIFLFINSHSS